MKTNGEVEKLLAEKFSETLADSRDVMPEGYHCEVHLRSKERAKKRNAPFEKYWSPDTNTIRIEFQRIRDKVQAGSQADVPDLATSHLHSKGQPAIPVADPLSDLIRALDRAESRPGYKFVALKWFRDTALQAEGFAWASEYSARHMTLRDAIERRLVLTSREPNPKTPQFPVTAIRLNRLMPEVKAILGGADVTVPDFEPLPIRGESLSQTVLSERR